MKKIALMMVAVVFISLGWAEVSLASRKAEFDQSIYNIGDNEAGKTVQTTITIKNTGTLDIEKGGNYKVIVHLDDTYQFDVEGIKSGESKDYNINIAYPSTVGGFNKKLKLKLIYSTQKIDLDDAAIRGQVIPANRPPVVSISGGGNLKNTECLTLKASASDPDGDSLSYNWYYVTEDKDVGTSSNYTVCGSEYSVKTHRFKVIVNDGHGGTAYADTLVTVVSNTSPTARLNLTRFTLTKGGSEHVELNACSSSDAENDPLSYTWTKNGNSNTIGNNCTYDVIANNYEAGEHTFTVKVKETSTTEQFSDSETATITIKNSTVTPPPTGNQKPIANIDDTFAEIKENESFTLEAGDCYDPDGGLISYRWEDASGNLLGTMDKYKVEGSAYGAGRHDFTLVVIDDENDSAKAYATVKIISNTQPVNQAPTAIINPNYQDIAINETCRLDSYNSTDPEDNDNNLTCLWEKKNGENWEQVSTSKYYEVVGSVYGLGIYKFRLTIKDSQGLSGQAEATVRIKQAEVNKAPIAKIYAGNKYFASEYKMYQNESLTLIGTDSVDSNLNDTLTYKWEKLNGSSATTVSTANSYTIFGNNHGNANSNNSYNVGEYNFKLTVTDQGGLSNSATVKVKVNPVNVTVPIPPVSSPDPQVWIEYPSSLYTYGEYKFTVKTRNVSASEVKELKLWLSNAMEGTVSGKTEYTWENVKWVGAGDTQYARAKLTLTDGRVFKWPNDNDLPLNVPSITVVEPMVSSISANNTKAFYVFNKNEGLSYDYFKQRSVYGDIMITENILNFELRNRFSSSEQNILHQANNNPYVIQANNFSNAGSSEYQDIKTTIKNGGTAVINFISKNPLEIAEVLLAFTPLDIVVDVKDIAMQTYFGLTGNEEFSKFTIVLAGVGVGMEIAPIGDAVISLLKGSWTTIRKAISRLDTVNIGLARKFEAILVNQVMRILKSTNRFELMNRLKDNLLKMQSSFC